eukprot:5607117-Pyramimonas_sp.AAC.1
MSFAPNKHLLNGHPVGPGAGATRPVAMAAPRANDPDLRMPRMQRRGLPRMTLVFLKEMETTIY